MAKSVCNISIVMFAILKQMQLKTYSNDPKSRSFLLWSLELCTGIGNVTNALEMMTSICSYIATKTSDIKAKGRDHVESNNCTVSGRPIPEWFWYIRLSLRMSHNTINRTILLVYITLNDSLEEWMDCSWNLDFTRSKSYCAEKNTYLKICECNEAFSAFIF